MGNLPLLEEIEYLREAIKEGEEVLKIAQGTAVEGFINEVMDNIKSRLDLLERKYLEK